MKIQKLDYIGLDHKKVCDNYEGGLTFVNYMNVEDIYGNNFVAAVYKASNPNREKGHKDYMLIRSHYDPVLMRSTLYVLGRDKDEMEKIRHHSGILCSECDTVLLSLYRHDYHGCGCANETFVDGGSDYLRYGGKSLSKIKSVKVDLLTDEVTVE